MPDLTGQTPSPAEPKRMALGEAQAVAHELVEAMRPYCQRIAVAGSIRREKPEDIKDVEIVAVPRWEERPADVPEGTLLLFDEAPETVQVNTLHEWAIRQSAPGPARVPTQGVCWIKAGTQNVVAAWEKSVPDGTGRYWRGLLVGGATLDLFLTTPERWGATLLVRTGSWDFSREIVTRARTNKRYRFGKGGLCHWFEDKQEAFADLVPTPEEADVFALLGLAYVPPSERTGPHAVRAARPTERNPRR